MNSRSKAIRAKLQIEGKIVFELEGRCMDPLLLAGDCVKVVPVSVLEEGLLYLVELPKDKIALHRLVRCFDGKAFFKGDRSRGYETLASEDIIGQADEVKLRDDKAWHAVNSGRKIKTSIAKLSWSRHTDKSEKQNAPLRVATRLLSLMVLQVYSRYKRLLWRISD